MSFKKKSYVEFFSAIMGSLTSLILAFCGQGVWALVWGYLALSLTKTILLNLVSPYFQLPCFSFGGMKHIFSFGGYVTLTRLLWLFYTNADVLIVGRILGMELLGLYSVAATLASIPMEKISGLINQVAFPAFSYAKSDLQKASAYYLKSIRLMSFFAFPSLWGISSISPELIRLFLGERWIMCGAPLQLLSLIIPFRMIGNLGSPAVTGIGRPELSFYFNLLCALFLPVGILTGTRWGLLGVCLAWIALYPPLLVVYLSQTAKAFGLRFKTVAAEMARPVSAALAMYLTVISVKHLLPTKYILTRTSTLFLIGVVVYGVVVLLSARELCHEVISLFALKSRRA